MKDLINHFNRKKKDFNVFFTSLAQIIEQVSCTTQLQIDKQYDAIMGQFSNAPQETISLVCIQMEKNRNQTFKNIVQILYEQLKAHINITSQQNQRNIQNYPNHNKDSITKYNNIQAASVNNNKNGQKIQINEHSGEKIVSKSPPKIVFKNNPTNSFQFNYNNNNNLNNRLISQSYVQQFKQISSLQEIKVKKFSSHNIKNQSHNMINHFSGKMNNLQKVNQFNSVDNRDLKNSNQDYREKSKKKLSVTQICSNLDKHILSQANQLLIRSESRKRFSSLKKSSTSLRRSPQNQGKFINTGTFNIDKILQSRNGENFGLNNSKKIVVVGSDEYTSPIKKYNI